MCIWNKVLVGLIGVASLVLFYMAARALNTETYWSKSALAHEKKIKQLTEQNRELMEGTENQKGIRQLDVEVQKMLADRRRVWAECESRVKPGIGMVEATLAVNQTDAKGQPVPHGIANGVVLYAFEKANVQDKGQYLGEFAVAKVIDKDKQILLVPTARLSQREINKVVKSKRPWVLYEVMPQDSHEVFASLSDDEKKALLPADSLREYVKDGKPAEKDDPPENVVGGNYVRPLLDYNILFNDERAKSILLEDAIVSMQQDKKLLQDALAEARTQADACARDIASTTATTEKVQREVTVVTDLLTRIEKNLAAVEKQIGEFGRSNQARAGQLAKLQLEAAQKIDQRTRAMAQTGAGRM